MFETKRPPALLFAAAAAIALTVLSTPWALALGVACAWGRLAPSTDNGQRKLSQWVKRLLPLCVVGLGAGMPLGIVLQTGMSTVLPTAISIAVCFVVGLALAVRLRVGREVATLMTAGTAICGGSAIAATSDALGAKASNITVALSTIFVLNGLALVVFPPLGHALALSPESFGAFAALAIHDTSSVVGAAANYDAAGVALEVATATKLARALWIVPVTLVIGLLATRAPGRASGRVAKPWFILGFLLAAAFFSLTPELQAVGEGVSDVAKRGLSLVLFLVGAQLTPATVRATGARSLAFATTLWLVMCVVSLALVSAFSLGA